ncbi:DUF6686 family protein [Chryseolinea sp. H1M3-3]|uniref:DUF6686 family protein n=1 Tax=Chryseolinea sp. H1M3-3 TaxID=3034144 RepID=UPI0023EAB96C|nr:DUF6686 family protein [Chryseolinea sp. H1M3-3]
MECSERIYHQNKLGCTRKCSCHNAVHLIFGNVSLLLSKQQLNDFTEYIADAVVECKLQGSENPDCRDIFIPTRDLCIFFNVTYSELEHLLDLAEQTVLMLQIDEALSGHG